MVAFKVKQLGGWLQNNAARIFIKVELELLLVHAHTVTQLSNDEVRTQVKALLYVHILVHNATHVVIKLFQKRETRAQFEVLPPLLNA